MEQNAEMLSNKITVDCWNSALDCFGLQYVYSKKIQALQKWLNASKIAGVLIPVIIAGILGSSLYSPKLLDITIMIAAPFGLAQFILSCYLAVAGSDNNLMVYITRAEQYSLLASEYRRLANFPDFDYEVYLKKYDILVERERIASRGDYLSEKELRKAMRFGLREFGKQCAGCNEKVISMKPTDCDVCGNF